MINNRPIAAIPEDPTETYDKRETLKLFQNGGNAIRN
ncbi:MAG: hypothetical protein Ct9H300mP28_13780 [Pseudomonadota bacterium]|nr:MAG: hypothetical protein Ct9H300mP28_13780 [Pseudomonadota bacterium]